MDWSSLPRERVDKTRLVPLRWERSGAGIAMISKGVDRFGRRDCNAVGRKECILHREHYLDAGIGAGDMRKVISKNGVVDHEARGRLEAT
jgi:hypothetical protein